MPAVTKSLASPPMLLHFLFLTVTCQDMPLPYFVTFSSHHTSQATLISAPLAFSRPSSTPPSAPTSSRKPLMISNAAHNHCVAISACLEAFHTASSPQKIKSAFAAGLVITVDSGLSVDPSRLAIHLPGTIHFTKATLPPTRTALYSSLTPPNSFP